MQQKHSLLKQYYLKRADRLDPLDIDKQEYHPQAALNLLEKDFNYIQFISYSNTLSNDIKQLDGNMKTLVYQNYSKFLAAQEVIRKIKKTSIDMEEQVSNINDKMSLITTRLASLSHIDAKIKNTQDLYNVNDLMVKLDYIISMPRILVSLLNNKKYSEAVLFYSKANKVLYKYHSSPFFANLSKECFELLKFITVKIRDKVFSGTGSVIQISEGIGMLVALESDPASDLAKQFVYKISDLIDKILGSQKFSALIKQESMIRQDSISRYSMHLKLDSKDSFVLSPKNILDLNNKQSPAQTPTAIETSINNTPEVILTSSMIDFTKFNRTFLNDLSLFADCYDAFFIEPRTEASTLRELDELKMGVFAKSLSDEHRDVAKTNLKTILKEKLDKYFAYVDTQLSLPQQISTTAFSQFVQILSILRSEISNAFVLKRLANIDARLATLTVTVLDRIINGVFSKVSYDLFAKIKSLIASKSQLSTFNRQITSWMKETLISKALPALEDFLDPNNSSSLEPIEILNRIQAALLRFWEELGQEMINSKKNDSNPYLLILARLSQELSNGGIEAIFSMYNERLFIKATGDKSLEIMENSKDLTVMYQNLAHQLSSRSVQIEVSEFIHKIREYLQSISNQEEGKLWKEMKQSLQEFKTNVLSSFQQEGKEKRLYPNEDGNNTLESMIDTLDLLFNERIEYLPMSIPLKTDLMLGAIVKSILKCLIEEIRMKELDVLDAQKLQSDLKYIKLNFTEFCDLKLLELLTIIASKSIVLRTK